MPGRSVQGISGDSASPRWPPRGAAWESSQWQAGAVAGFPRERARGGGRSCSDLLGAGCPGRGHGEDRRETVIERSRLKISKIGEGCASSGSGSSVKTGQDMRQDVDTESKGEVLSAAGEGRAAPVTEQPCRPRARPAATEGHPSTAQLQSAPGITFTFRRVPGASSTQPWLKETSD